MSKQPDSFAHARYRNMLERHLDGELDMDGRMELFEHMENCEECREILEAEERLIDRLAKIPRLKAPSDLRVQILQEVERERLDSQPLDQDERYAAIFATPDEDERAERIMAASRRPRRTLFQRYSSVAAVLFLAVAGIGALLSSDLRNAPPLQAMQTGVLHSVQRAGAAIARLALPDDQGTVLAQSPPAQYVPQPPEQFDVPKPAEQLRPTVAAIVLLPTDSDTAVALSYDHDEFGEAMTSAVSRPAVDQFVYDGHRFRCYTVEVEPTWVDGLLEALDACRAETNIAMLQVIREQTEDLPVAESVQFFAAPGAVLRNAVLENKMLASADPARLRRLKIFVVE